MCNGTVRVTAIHTATRHMNAGTVSKSNSNGDHESNDEP